MTTATTFTLLASTGPLYEDATRRALASALDPMSDASGVHAVGRHFLACEDQVDPRPVPMFWGGADADPARILFVGDLSEEQLRRVAPAAVHALSDWTLVRAVEAALDADMRGTGGISSDYDVMCLPAGALVLLEDAADIVASAARSALAGRASPDIVGRTIGSCVRAVLDRDASSHALMTTIATMEAVLSRMASPDGGAGEACASILVRIRRPPAG